MNRLVSLIHGRREAPFPPIQRAPLPEDDQADPPKPAAPPLRAFYWAERSPQSRRRRAHSQSLERTGQAWKVNIDRVSVTAKAWRRPSPTRLTGASSDDQTGDLDGKL